MSGSGKTTFIKENFPNHKVLDIWEYQNVFYNMYNEDKHIPFVDRVLKSYELLKESILTEVKKKEYSTIIVEHTLLKANRREYYLTELISHNVDIIAYFISPSKETFFKNNPKRNINDYDNSKQIQEIPNEIEGFNEIHIINT